MTRTITDLQARLFRVPLGESMGDAMHGLHTHFELVTVTIRTADGLEGTGYTYTGGTRTVDVHVRRLREKLPFLADAIVTVKQFGYKLVDPAPRATAAAEP